MGLTSGNQMESIKTIVSGHIGTNPNITAFLSNDADVFGVRPVSIILDHECNNNIAEKELKEMSINIIKGMRDQSYSVSDIDNIQFEATTRAILKCSRVPLEKKEEESTPDDIGMKSYTGKTDSDGNTEWA